MSDVSLSRFTPSVLSPETLEAIFVQRERLASTLVERIRSSALTPSKHYSLIIGPRGIGKTHLVSLVYHRIKGDDQLADRLLCAWLREEEWGITSFLDLLLSVLRTLRQDLGDAEYEAAYQRLFELEADQAEFAAEQLLLSTVADRTLLVIVENLEDVFEGVGESGQQKLRAYIQNHPFWTILGTSQSLFKGISLQDSPFYGFFEVTHLQELSFKDAVTLLIKIAEYQDDRDLARDLHTTLGRSRIRAVHHLAAGNPRVYVILSQFLTSRSLDQLVEPLMRTLDDMTPYYQARMSYLSPQQRKLVEFLCERRGAVAVKEIAKRNFLTHPTVSSQLKRLRELGYVRPAHQVGRESFFELREPLMRLSLEVKRQRGEPIRLLVDFLRLWFSREELRKRLDDLGEESRLDKRYLVRAMESYGDGSGDPRVGACLKDYGRLWAEGAYDKALLVAEELVEIRGFPTDWMRRSKCLAELGDPEEAERCRQQALDLEIEGLEARRDRALMLSRLKLYEELLDFTERILAETPENSEMWWRRATALVNLKRYEEAIKAFDRSLKLNPNASAAWTNRGWALSCLGRLEEALAAYDRALEIEEDQRVSLRKRVRTLLRLERLEDAITASERLLEFYPEDEIAIDRKAKALCKLGRQDEALRFIEAIIRSGPESARAWLTKGRILNSKDAYDEAQSQLRKATKLRPEDALTWVDLGACLDRLGRYEEALEAVKEASKLEPALSWIWMSLGVCYYRCGRLEDSLESLDRALAIEPDQPDCISNRAIALSSLGRHEEALGAFDRAIELQKRSVDFHVESNRAATLMLLGRWEAGRKALECALGRFSEEEIKQELGEIAIVRNMLIRTQREETWRRHIAVWIELFERHDRLTVLGQGLVRTIRTLTIPWITAEMARSWNSVWQELGARKPGLAISLRLFDAAVRYRESGDERVLLALPAEERALLEPLLGAGGISS